MVLVLVLVLVVTQALTCTTQVSGEQTMLLKELPHRQPVIALWFPECGEFVAMVVGAQSKAVLEEVQWVVVCMAATMSMEDIAMYTQISPRNVRGIISHFNTHCTVCTPACARAKVHRTLSDDHINHLLQTLNSMPDLYLNKLCMELEATTPYLYFKSL
ncbi:hypothetical protein BJV74DRAFT_795399 [Russula compacta]|nr:hypothetical protein BJV74DRAFT_795399 [Russula compacta]